MFHWLRPKQNDNLYVGLAMHKEGIAVAVLRAESDGGVGVETLHWRARKGDEQIQSLLPDLLAQCGAIHKPLVAVLPADAYELIQVEKPDVSDDELQDALRWRVKDLVDFPVQDAVIDSFLLPPGQRPGAPQLTYVIAAPAERVAQLGGWLAKSKARVCAIDVPELAFRDLVMHTGVENRAHAYLYLQPGQALIEIGDGEQIFVTRQIPLIEGMWEMPVEQRQGMVESLVLEVQRSLDYFESQFGGAPVDQVYVLATQAEMEQAFMNVAVTYLALPVEQLELSDIEGLDAHDEQTVRHAYLAMGAAIREMPCVA